MLKRISQLSNIGRFKSSTPGNVQFDKITYIFGRNTYGKSTLGDLLSSVETGNLDAVSGRKTIPSDGLPQQAVLSFQAEGEKETPVRLSRNGWTPNLPGDLNLHVFDDGFFHNNVFAARQFTRATKVNFSSFILGAQGVAKAKAIEDKNKLKRAATQEKSTLDKAVFKDIEGISDFLTLAPDEDADVLSQRIERMRIEYTELAQQKKNAINILGRKELLSLKWETDFSTGIDGLNEVMEKSLQAHHEQARDKVGEHIRKSFKDVQGADVWIKQGLNQNLGKRCQFCGRDLDEDARQLLDLYSKCFDESYKQHELFVAERLATLTFDLTRERLSDLKLAIESNQTTVANYPELQNNPQYLELKNVYLSAISQLNDAFLAWDNHLFELKPHLSTLVERKKQEPHLKIDKIDAAKLVEVDRNISELVHKYNESLHELNESLRGFKKSVDGEAIEKKLDALKRDGAIESRKLNRLKLSEQCVQYGKLLKIISELSTEIPKLQEELKQEQSLFLDRFYDRLNHYFREFGNRDFVLKRGEDNAGHLPIFYLKVEFRGHNISERELERVFSESDRRALALAVFWASMASFSREEIKGMIVVLDDPVTSFDNNRITAVHQKIVELADATRQVIVLSHYEQDVVRFLKTYKNNKPVKLLSIESASGSSHLENADIELFIKNEHEKVRDKVLKFVAGEANSHNCTDLRVFFEYEIDHRFAKQIKAHNIYESNLSDRIDSLYKTGVIAEETANQAQVWRETLNPEHHIWVGSDIEDQRNSAASFMDFVYDKLVPISSNA